MRLSSQIASDIVAIARDAIAGEREIAIPASTPRRASEMFLALKESIAMHGGKPDEHDLAWRFANGSTIRVVHADALSVAA